MRRQGTLDELDSLAQRDNEGSRERKEAKNQDLVDELDQSKSMAIKTPTEYKAGDQESHFSGVLD